MSGISHGFKTFLIAGEVDAFYGRDTNEHLGDDHSGYTPHQGKENRFQHDHAEHSFLIHPNGSQHPQLLGSFKYHHEHGIIDIRYGSYRY